jgi:hypothetical protein
MHLSGHLPNGWQSNGQSIYADNNYGDRAGWRELVVQGGPGVSVVDSSASAVDLSNELRAYQQEFIANPPNMSSATFTLVPSAVEQPTTQSESPSGSADQSSDAHKLPERVISLARIERLSWPTVLLWMVAALLWGGGHALSLGRDGAVEASDPTGNRRFSVDLTQVAGVLAMGLVGLFLTYDVLSETFEDWLGVICGLLVIAIGCALVVDRLVSSEGARKSCLIAQEAAEHNPDVHTPAGNGVAIGRTASVSDMIRRFGPGLSALTLLFGATALGHLEFGVALVMVFGVAYAIVVYAIGKSSAEHSSRDSGSSPMPRFGRLASVAGAIGVTIAGLVLVIGALDRAGVL